LAGQTDDLKSQIDSLQTRLDQIEKQQATIGTNQVAAPADAVVGGDFPGSFKLPGADTSYSIHGSVKLGFAYDSNQSIGDAFQPPNFKANNAPSGNYGLHFGGFANQSKLHIETRTPTDYGQMKTVMEFDYRTGSGPAFNGNNVVGTTNAPANDPTGKGIPRLRLAYGVLGPIEAGKDYYLFSNDFASAPEVIDYWGPQGIGYASRVPLLRYTQVLGKFMLAGEIAAPAATGAEGIGFNDEQAYFTSGTTNGTGATVTGSAQYSEMPEFSAGADYTDAWGHVSVRGKLRELHLENGGGGSTAANTPTYTLTAYGYAGYVGANVNMGTFLPVLGKDSLAGAIIWGVGDAEDMSASDDEESASVINYGGTGAKITATPMHGFQVNYRHWWTPTIRSNLAWGLSQLTPSHDSSANSLGTALSSSTAAEETQAQDVYANIIWSPVSTVNFGLEYIWGEVHHLPYVNGTTTSTSGNGFTGYGSNQRLELGMQYLF
jgi:hypothetical protein